MDAIAAAHNRLGRYIYINWFLVEIFIVVWIFVPETLLSSNFDFVLTFRRFILRNSQVRVKTVL